MNRLVPIILMLIVFYGCKENNSQIKRIPVAKAGNEVLYYDEISDQVKNAVSPADSTAEIQNYINKWAKRELMFQKAEANLSPELRNEIEEQLQSTRVNLVVYEYQRMMMLQNMDTVITEEELEDYYKANEKSFMLTSNIVKALFIKLPVETPNISKIKSLARSNAQKDFQELESLCYQFAEKFDDFNEEWITMDRLSLELNEDISNQENFLKKTTFYETGDSSSVYLIAINDYRLRGTLSPFEYVREDIKRIIWNNRRITFIQELENGIYNEALKENSFKIY
jgi:HEPN domain-containing protein